MVFVNVKTKTLNTVSVNYYETFYNRDPGRFVTIKIIDDSTVAFISPQSYAICKSNEASPTLTPIKFGASAMNPMAWHILVPVDDEILQVCRTNKSLRFSEVVIEKR